MALSKGERRTIKEVIDRLDPKSTRLAEELRPHLVALQPWIEAWIAGPLHVVIEEPDNPGAAWDRRRYLSRH